MFFLRGEVYVRLINKLTTVLASICFARSRTDGRSCRHDRRRIHQARQVFIVWCGGCVGHVNLCLRASAGSCILNSTIHSSVPYSFNRLQRTPRWLAGRPGSPSNTPSSVLSRRLAPRRACAFSVTDIIMRLPTDADETTPAVAAAEETAAARRRSADFIDRRICAAAPPHTHGSRRLPRQHHRSCWSRALRALLRRSSSFAKRLPGVVFVRFERSASENVFVDARNEKLLVSTRVHERFGVELCNFLTVDRSWVHSDWKPLVKIDKGVKVTVEFWMNT